MRTFLCVCNNVVFFDNTQCVACGHELGFCPACRNLVALVPQADGSLHCGNSGCGAALVKCLNYSEHKVCNRCLTAPGEIDGGLCDCCRFNATIPDLSVAGNLEKWRLLETAKRRLLYDLDQLGLPYGTAADNVLLPLSFDFKADVIPAGKLWRWFGKTERVYTGHAAGRITINIREADAVAREKLRVDFGEAQRTLIGHFRHEIGHYYWDVLVQGRCEDEFKAIFGDHNQPNYSEALDIYYKNGPRADWRGWFASAYATMHPWEDFAESWATCLDLTSTLETARHVGLDGASQSPAADFKELVTRYQRLGIALNEISRNVGLLDVVPEILAGPVVEKMDFIYRLIREVPRSASNAPPVAQVSPAPAREVNNARSA